MPDLLPHALIAYAAARLLSWRYRWITIAHVNGGNPGSGQESSSTSVAVSDAVLPLESVTTSSTS